MNFSHSSCTFMALYHNNDKILIIGIFKYRERLPGAFHLLIIYAAPLFVNDFTLQEQTFPFRKNVQISE